MIGKARRKRALFALSPIHAKPIRSPLEYRMSFGGERLGAPSVAPPIQRQSLAQPVLVTRSQESRYISPYARLISPFPSRLYPNSYGYPVERVMTTIGTRPPANSVPMQSARPRVRGMIPVGSTVRTSRGGTMRATPRFKKALPLAIPVFNPPVYGA